MKNIQRRFAMVSTGLLLLGAGCFVPSQELTRPETAAFAVMPTSTSTLEPAPKDVPDPCTVVSPGLVKKTMGMTVQPGVTKKSSVGGMACEFLGVNPASDLLVQFSGLPNQFYAPEKSIRHPLQLGIGEKGIYKEVEYGQAFGQFVQDGRLVYVNLSTKATVTTAQWKAFFMATSEALKRYP